jgi:small subunit ribosomal protein S20
MLLAGLGPAASSPVSELKATGRYSTALRGAPRQSAQAAASFHMANIASQKKRILRSERERIENRKYTSAIKTYFRRLEALAKESDSEATEAEHRRLVRTIDKAVKRGALHRNTGARKKSRAARVAAGKSS